MPRLSPTTSCSPTPKNISCALFTRPEATNITINASYTTRWRLRGGRRRHGRRADHVSRHHRLRHHHGGRLLDHQMGLLASARGAGARQHRFDGQRRQDDRAQDGDQKPADAAQRRRHQQRRRLCLDHSVQQGRQCRRRTITTPTGSTGPIGIPTIRLQRRRQWGGWGGGGWGYGGWARQRWQ